MGNTSSTRFVGATIGCEHSYPCLVSLAQEAGGRAPVGTPQPRHLSGEWALTAALPLLPQLLPPLLLV